MADGSFATEVLGRSLHVRAIRSDMREADFVCSTGTLDSWGTKLDQKTWKLDRYKANPVVLFAHKSCELPVGQARNVRVENGQLVATIWFTSTTEQAERVWQQVKEGTLRGVSVGFLPAKVECFEDDDTGEQVVLLSDLELVELSITPVPANPDCLAQLRARASAPLTRASSDASPKNPPKAALSSAEKTTMTDEEIKALQARAADLATKTAETEARAKALVEERDAAVARAASLEKSLADATTERDIAEKRAKESETRIGELEVRALVGVKITPAEEPEFVELRATNKSLFEKMIEKRAVMAHTSQVIPDAGNQTPPAPVDSRASDEAALAAFNAALKL